MVIRPDTDSGEMDVPAALDLPKLSTTLTTFGEPVLAGLSEDVDVEKLRLALSIVCVAWNAAGPACPENPATAAGVRASFADAGLNEVMPDLDDLLARRRRLFGHDPRLAGRPELIDEDGRRRIRVATIDTAPLRAAMADPSRVSPRAGLHPAFVEFLRESQFDHRFLEVGVPPPSVRRAGWTRSAIQLLWQDETAVWNAPSLTSLFRGDSPAPDDFAMLRDPERYLSLLLAVERSVVLVAEAEERDPLDREVLEAYSALRRLPDGRGTGFLFDVAWQQVAVDLATHTRSAAEFAGVMRQLECSVRRHRTDPLSREYVAFLRDEFDDVRDALFAWR